ncbi:MAG: 1-acyl-sn-glycerol-3-phosphate acyltransferase [Acidimicrobiia bacterium]|nr:1-acyl-sn-glycerol-3-phosphate acyltransferase [Acidimicrobiia bacterium]
MTTPSRKDRFIARLVAFLDGVLYRDVVVHWAQPPPPDGPQLTVANHFGGLSDALVLLHVVPRRPGIVARDVIWRIPVVGWFMTWIGGIPVHKPEDREGRRGATSNDQMFASCYQALHDGGNLLIFPEGVTRNEPSIAPLKTGAARIVLGARTAGTEGIVVVPIGIHYEDKAALRSRVVVKAGMPIDLDAEVEAQAHDPAAVDAEDRDAVTQLTALIEERLRRAAPDYADWDEATALTLAADVALRERLDEPRQPVPIELRDRLANALAQRPADQKQRIQQAADTYQADLDGLGVSDAGLHHRLSTGRVLLSLVVQLLVGLILLPFALMGAVVNLIPFLVVKTVGLLRVAPSVHSTIKPIVAIVAFGIAWGVVIWTAGARYGLTAAAAALVLMPVYLAAALALADRARLWWRTVRRWRAERKAAGIEDRLRAHRDAVVDAVISVEAA